MKLKIPTNRLALLGAAFCAAMLAFSHNANALRMPLPPSPTLTIGDQHTVGSISPAAPADPSSVAEYINFMITLAAPTGPTQHDFGGAQGVQTISRSANVFASLPNAVFLSNGHDTGTTTTVDLGAGGVYTYLFAKYDGQNDISQVWFVGDLSGIITIPANGPLGYALSGWILFGPGTPGVPDGGITAMLLGAAIGALGVVRRYIMR